MVPNSLPEPTILNVLLAQTRMEGKIDGLLAQLKTQSEDIDLLWKRTNEHSKDISQLKAHASNVNAQLDQTVSRGFTAVAVAVSAGSLLLTLVFNVV